MMTVRVELYGIPRHRAGVANIDVTGETLGDVLHRVGIQIPSFAEHCLDGRHLRHGFLANINGELFVTAPETPVNPGDAVLILSSDIGG